MSTIDVWADIRCPWCWMGHRRLMSLVEGTDVVVRHRSFLLEPGGPEGEHTTVREAALTSWGMDAQGWEELRGRVESAGVRAGLAIEMAGVRAIDSRPGHRLLKFAESRGVDAHLAWDRVFAAHLRHHEDLEDPEVLRRLGGEWGVDAGELDDLLDGDAFASEVEADHRVAVELGVRSVPSFVHAGQVLSGYRETHELAALFDLTGVAR